MDHPTFAYRFGTAEFDESRFELRVAGLPVEVERRALEVLAYLLRHSGEVVTKDELFRDVWEGRATVEKVLPNAIVKLRRALGEANASHVSTVARLGYRLEGPVSRTAVGRHATSELALEAGAPMPGRAHWVAQRQLGRSTGSEVWLAEHAKTHELRVYKFALDADRLRALKREATLLRVLHESLDDTDRFVELLDWNFSTEPYFLECKYGGESLSRWAKEYLAGLDTERRLALFLQIADAVAAAHAVGVLHKDLKPSNILISGDAAEPRVRLTDFGSGHMLEPDNLAQLGITRMGMTVDERAPANSISGTPLYVAPELFAGQAPTLKSDVFSLGILLYQLLSGRIDQPMVSDWEHQIADPLLREDLKLASAGDPHQRLASVDALTTRLRQLQARRDEAQRATAARAQTEADKQRLALARARKPYLVGLFTVLVAGVLVAAGLASSAVQSRKRAELAAQEVKALNDFLSQDLISRTNPAVMAKGSSVQLKDALLMAQNQIADRFANQPTLQARVHKSLAELFSAIDLAPESEAHARAALAIHRDAGTDNSVDAQSVQSTLAILLASKSDFAQSDAIIQSLSDALSKQDASDQQRYLLSYARAVNLFNKGAYSDAVPHYAVAIDALARAQPGNVGLMNAIRRNQIHGQTMAAQYGEAADNAKRFLQELEGRPGDQSLWMALVKLASARSVGYQGRADEALRMLSEAESVIAERFGTKSLEFMALQMETLAVATRSGNFARAFAIAEQLAEAVRAQYGEQHPQTAKMLFTSGWVAFEAERDDRASELLKSGCAALEKTLGVKSALTQNCFVAYTAAHLASGRTDDAQAWLNKIDVGVLRGYRAIKADPEVIRDGAQGLIDLAQGDASGRKKVLAAIEALDKSVQPKDRFYRLLKAAEARGR